MEQYSDLQKLWTNINSWNEKNMEWLTSDFCKLNAENIAKEVFYEKFIESSFLNILLRSTSFLKKPLMLRRN